MRRSRRRGDCIYGVIASMASSRRERRCGDGVDCVGALGAAMAWGTAWSGCRATVTDCWRR
ncbi:MAG: hypothetical protein K8F29_09690 [Kofleriaceae bacterium]|nr:hypothetical protein [Candidatus Methylomirabilis lanthanidiphila]